MIIIIIIIIIIINHHAAAAAAAAAADDDDDGDVLISGALHCWLLTHCCWFVCYLWRRDLGARAGAGFSMARGASKAAMVRKHTYLLSVCR